MASPVITNPLGAFGTTDVAEKFGGGVLIPFEATAAITAKQAVTITTAGKITKATTGGAAAGTTIGICMDTVAAGEIANVCVLGPVSNVPADGSIAAGSPVIASTTTAGSVIAKAAPTTGEGLGFAIAAAANDVVTIWVTRSIGGIT